jgi:A-macroglobulin receptor binding domain
LKAQESGMAVLELNQLTGFTATNLDTIKDQSNGTVMRIENDGEKVVLYFNEVRFFASSTRVAAVFSLRQN